MYNTIYLSIPILHHICDKEKNLLLLDLALFLLLQKPIHTSRHTLLQRPQRLVAQHLFGLCNIIIPRHGRKDYALLGQRGLFLHHAGSNLAQHAEHKRRVTRKPPHAARAGLVASGTPHSARKVPKVHGRVVCDEEDFAVHALVIERRGARRGGGEEETGGEEVGVGDVADIGKVKDVGVVSELEVAFAAAVGAEEAGEGLHVAFAEDAGWAERGSEEVGGFGTVGFDDEFFGCGLERWDVNVSYKMHFFDFFCM